MMLTLLISRPEQLGNDIDIYLGPLIDDIMFLWNIRVEVYDGYKEEPFDLKVMLFGTINDFLACGNHSGYSIKEKTACLVCEDNTFRKRLPYSEKKIYIS